MPFYCCNNFLFGLYLIFCDVRKSQKPKQNTLAVSAKCGPQRYGMLLCYKLLNLSVMSKHPPFLSELFFLEWNILSDDVSVNLSSVHWNNCWVELVEQSDQCTHRLTDHDTGYITIACM